MRSASPLHLIAALACVLLASACTPKGMLLSALLPQNTVNIVLGNLERVPDENRRRVAELEKAGRWPELASLAEAELSKDRANADWWLIAGYANSRSGKHHRAAEAYNEVVRLEPDNAAGWHLLAQSHRAAGEPERAVRVLERARYALRDSPLTPYLLGESYSDLKRYDLAVPAYRDALRIEERFPAAWFALAMSYARLGRTGEAREAGLRLEKLDPAAAERLRSAIATGTPER